MRLTPVQIRKQEFSRKVRGFDPDEVEAFLAVAASDFEEILRENTDLKAQKSAIIEELQNYKKLEETLRSLIVQAEKTASESSAALKNTSEIIQRETEARAQQVLNAASREVEQTKKRLAELKQLRESMASGIRSVLTAQLEMLDSLESDNRVHEPANELLDVRSIVESLQKSEDGGK